MEGHDVALVADHSQQQHKTSHLDLCYILLGAGICRQAASSKIGIIALF
jgi:hypothetical protein